MHFGRVEPERDHLNLKLVAVPSWAAAGNLASWARSLPVQAAMSAEAVLRSSGRQVSSHLGWEAAAAGAAVAEATVMGPSVAGQIMATWVVAAAVVGTIAAEQVARPTTERVLPARSLSPSRCPSRQLHFATAAEAIAEEQADLVRQNQAAIQYPRLVLVAVGVVLIAFAAATVVEVAVAAEEQQTEA